MSISVLKLKTSFNDDIRVFKTKFIDDKDALNKLGLFICESYNLNMNKFIMQYKDNENDLITIINYLDLNDAIQQGKHIKKTPKIFIKKSCCNPVLKAAEIQSKAEDNEPKVVLDEQPKVVETKVDDSVTGNDNNEMKEESNNDVLTGVLSEDICYNTEFRKEFILFLKATVLLYQTKIGDLITCIVTALSKYSKIAKHKSMQEIIAKMNVLAPKVEQFVSKMLIGFDVKNIEIMVNKFVSDKLNNGNPFEIFESMGLIFPFIMFNKTCKGKTKMNCNNHDNKSEGKVPQYRADIVEDVSPKVSNSIDANTNIVKLWKMKNSGNIDLPKDLIVKYSGRNNNAMINNNEFNIGNDDVIKPGQIFDVKVSIKTPSHYGRYNSNWRLVTKDGQPFGQKLSFVLVLTPPHVKSNEDNTPSKPVNASDNSSELKEDIKEDNISPKPVNITDNNSSVDDNDDIKEDITVDKDGNAINIEGIETNSSDSFEIVDAPMKDYKYVKQFNELKSMGFIVNDDCLIEALNVNSGDVNKVLALLLDNNN